ncbi:MAG: hypothetical protein Kow0025_16470 [Thermodesulfovibrionales bacterium]
MPGPAGPDPWCGAGQRDGKVSRETWGIFRDERRPYLSGEATSGLTAKGGLRPAAGSRPFYALDYGRRGEPFDIGQAPGVGDQV